MNKPYVMPINRPRKQLIAGIDPDIDKSGLAIYNTAEKRWVYHKAICRTDVMDTIYGCKPETIKIVMSAGWLTKGMYQHHKDNLPEDFDKWTIEGQLGYFFKRGMDVGRNHNEGQSMVKEFRRKGYEVIEHKPSTAKWDEATMALYTRLKLRTNQDVRDAIQTVWLNL